MPLTVNSFRVYLPAKTFEQSKRFYSALGFNMSEGWGGSADFELNESCFRLQNYYVEDWANNCMVAISVDDLNAWHQRARELESNREFDSVRIEPPKIVDGSKVMHIWDPSGVLLVFVE